jgi:nucleoside-triphosphatase THEP1
MTLEWIHRRENLAVSGASGTGKTHFVEALAHVAIEADLRVSWLTLESLTATVAKAKADGSVARAVARICGCDLICVDDIGMLPAGQEAAEAFYRVVDAAYERRSVAVTSNLHPSGFDSIMPKTLATATVDRLLHHAHLVTTKGDSHRLAKPSQEKESNPSSNPLGRTALRLGRQPLLRATVTLIDRCSGVASFGAVAMKQHWVVNALSTVNRNSGLTDMSSPGERTRTVRMDGRGRALTRLRGSWASQR